MKNNLSYLIVFGFGLALSACATTKSDTEYETATQETQRFEKLVYGAQKPLVCSETFLAEGNVKDRPNLQLMWENYLYDRPEGIWGEIGGYVEINGNLPHDQGRWTNACSVRLSHMLNKAGHKIPRQEDNKSVSGGNKDQYIYRVSDLEDYLKSEFGDPDFTITDGTGTTWDIPVKPGILLMDFKIPGNSFSGHVTVWNGAGTVDNADVGGKRILFWELPCFIPSDRLSASLNYEPITGDQF